MNIVKLINLIIALVFFVCYAYQIVYMAVPFLIKRRALKAPAEPHRYAVLISARNEEAVIAGLIGSIKAQSYDSELVTVFVVADNCTDKTAEVARRAGASVFQRYNKDQVGKGYALQFLLRQIDDLYSRDYFDGFFVFDADNVLEPDYIANMNAMFSQGCDIITSYRDSKNYGDNWISAGYALWFLRESKYLNDARMRLGTSCAVSGTGFLVSRKVMDECGGWSFFLLTEDIEFTAHNVVAGRTIAYCGDAVLYDEQPTRFSQSWNQRLRWAKGYLQVFGRYGVGLITGMARGSFSCFDMSMAIMPAAVLSVAGIINNGVGLFITLSAGKDPSAVLLSAFLMLADAYLTVFVIGALTTASEWRRIYAPTWKKLLFAFTFPIFMLTYIPISVVAVFSRRVTWKPIKHDRTMALEDIRTTA